MNPESKLDVHLLSIVLVWCLSKSCCPDLSVSEASVTQVVLFISLPAPANLSLKSTLLSRNCAGSDILTSMDADNLGLQFLLSSIKDRGCLASVIFCHGNSVYHLLSRYIVIIQIGIWFFRLNHSHCQKVYRLQQYVYCSLDEFMLS